MAAVVMSPEDRAQAIEELLDAYRFRDRLMEAHQLAPSRGIDSHRYPDILARCERGIARLEAMLDES